MESQCPSFMGTFILDKNNNPIHEPDILKWAAWLELGKRRVSLKKLEKYHISTVFLATDYNFIGKGRPILFETMVFENKVSKNKFLDGKEFSFHKSLDDFTRRYATWNEAKKGHKEVVKEIKQYATNNPSENS